MLAFSLSGMSNLACLAADGETARTPLSLWQEQAAMVAQQKTAAPATPEMNRSQMALLELAAPQPAKHKTGQIQAGPVLSLSSPLGAPRVGASADGEDFLSAPDVDDAVTGQILHEENSKSVLKTPLLLAAALPSEAAAPATDTMLLSGGASMSPEEAQTKIDSITRQILLKEIELERFNLHYTQEVARQGRWKGWRYAAFQEVNAGMGLTGAIISTAYRGARLNDAAKVKPCIQESANYVPMIGSYIGAGAAAMEFGINGYHDIIARSRGYGPAASIRKVAGIKADIDKMLAEREALCNIEKGATSLAGQCEIDAVEGKVLTDMLNQSLMEFERFHVGARRTIAFQQMQFFFDFSKYITNSLGYNFAFLALHRHHRRFNGNAGVLFMTSGALTMFGPIISRFVGKGVAELTEMSVHRSLGHSYECQISTLEGDLARLDDLVKKSRISNPSEKALDREAHYTDHEKCYADEISQAEAQKHKAVLTATQNVGAGLYVGGTKLASGVLFAVVGFNHHYRGKTNRSNHVTNDNLFAASVIAIPAGAFAMLDTLRIQVQGEIKRHKLAKKGMLQGQLVNKRLAALDDMEKRLRALN